MSSSSAVRKSRSSSLIFENSAWLALSQSCKPAMSLAMPSNLASSHERASFIGLVFLALCGEAPIVSPSKAFQDHSVNRFLPHSRGEVGEHTKDGPFRSCTQVDRCQTGVQHQTVKDGRAKRRPRQEATIPNCHCLFNLYSSTSFSTPIFSLQCTTISNCPTNTPNTLVTSKGHGFFFVIVLVVINSRYT